MSCRAAPSVGAVWCFGGDVVWWGVVLACETEYSEWHQ